MAKVRAVNLTLQQDEEAESTRLDRFFFVSARGAFERARRAKDEIHGSNFWIFGFLDFSSTREGTFAQLRSLRVPWLHSGTPSAATKCAVEGESCWRGEKLSYPLEGEEKRKEKKKKKRWV